MTHKSASAPEPCSQSSRKPPVEQGRSAAAVRKAKGETPGLGPLLLRVLRVLRALRGPFAVHRSLRLTSSQPSSPW